MKIKICGLKSLNDIQIINKVKIDYAGFIFAQNSKRKIDPQCGCAHEFSSSDFSAV